MAWRNNTILQESVLRDRDIVTLAYTNKVQQPSNPIRMAMIVKANSVLNGFYGQPIPRGNATVDKGFIEH